MSKREILSVTDNINESDNLCRYISLAQFLSMIENRMLFLKKVKSWEDTWEAPDDQLPIVLDDGSQRYAKNAIVDSTVGQCWTYERDSDAMWRIYSQDRQGIMIETDVSKFYEIENLKRAVLAKVIYYNLDNYIEKRKEIKNNITYFYVGDMALKREAFKHENEVRLLVCLQSYREMKNIYEIPTLGFSFDINSFIKSVTLDPRADEWFVDTIKKYCYSKGLTCQVKKSDLYERNFYQKSQIVMQFKPLNKD